MSEFSYAPFRHNTSLEHWMFDCEALGNGKDPVIPEFTFLRFDPITFEILDSTTLFPSIAEQINRFERTVDAKTLKFWFDQDRSISDRWNFDTSNLDKVRSYLREMFSNKERIFYAMGISYDFSVLNSLNDNKLRCYYRNLIDLRSFRNYFGFSVEYTNQPIHNSMVDCVNQLDFLKSFDGAMAQLGAQFLCMEEVEGSSPSSSTTI